MSRMRSSVKAVAVRLRALAAKPKVAAVMRSSDSLWVELGAGDRPGTGGWLTIDLGLRSDLTWDLRRGLPFRDSSVDRIYSSHFLEHLAFAEIQHLLGECVRVLVPGGSFSACVPNARLYLEAYFGMRSLDEDIHLAYSPAVDGTGKIDVVNYVAYMNGHHKYMWDTENLLQVLDDAGFLEARIRPFDASVDLRERDATSIYAEAVRGYEPSSGMPSLNSGSVSRF